MTTTARALAAAALLALTAISCSRDGTQLPTAPTPPELPASPAPPPPAAPPTLPTTWNVDRDGVPQFITHDYIDTKTIREISRFRSGEGHSYADAFETCRSMKHYFKVPFGPAAAAIPIYAPVSGTVVRTMSEWIGTQIHIEADTHPAFRVILFHVNASASIVEGAHVTAGEQIGTHVGDQTMSDVAVAVSGPDGFRLVSWFDAISEPLFEKYRSRGLSSRGDAVISRGERDASPLACDGEYFRDKGAIANWIRLQ